MLEVANRAVAHRLCRQEANRHDRLAGDGLDRSVAFDQQRRVEVPGIGAFGIGAFGIGAFGIGAFHQKPRDVGHRGRCRRRGSRIR
ncbi:hypothetical protein A5777_00005 [Gordonia sp. 852002-10350_SCH5691597]|nr:hypothetical protein A5777_00005 [Gordonia sp. 852002-10350_SCH5691597]